MNMNDLLIEGSVSSPTVRGEWENGILYMEGDSYPENSYELYSSMVAWVASYLKRKF